MWIVFTALVVLIIGISAQIPIPNRPLGFVYKGGSNDAPVHLDFYLDQVCPFSKQAWPTILQVAEEYGPMTVKLTVHLFPLPYHRNSFYASKGTHIVDRMTSGNQTYSWIKLIYDNMDMLVNNATFNVPDNKIVQLFADLASKNLGISSAMFSSLLLERDIELSTRLGWKYCCTRGVAATPTFMLNDVIVDGSPSWTVADWKSVIDPLLASSFHQFQVSNTTCPPGVKRCEYLPGKAECCKDGEFCIPNVGCRC